MKMNSFFIALAAFLSGGVGLWIFKNFFARKSEGSVKLEKEAAAADALTPIIDKIKKDVIRDTKEYHDRRAAYLASRPKPTTVDGDKR